MYLIHIPAARARVDHWLYFDRDPRPDGCLYDVAEGVQFEDLTQGVAEGGRSTRSLKMPVLARSVARPHYRVFTCKIAVPLDFEPLDGFAFHFCDWTDFMASPIAKDDQWRPLM